MNVSDKFSFSSRMIATVACATAMSFTSLAKAQENDADTVLVIQDKIFNTRHEIGAFLGHTPDDNFYEVFPVGFNYTYHFNDKYAWEVIRGSYMLNQEKDIKKDLENNFNVTPETFDEMTSSVETSFIYKPTYGKDSILNKSVINHEGFFSLGVGFNTYERNFSFGESESETAPLVSIGAGRKYFIGKNINVSLEIKDMMIFKEAGVENNVYFGIGLNYRFDMFEHEDNKPVKDQSIYKHLEK